MSIKSFIKDLDNNVKKSVDENGVITIYPMDNIKVEFKDEKDCESYTFDDVNVKGFEDEKGRWWGEYTDYVNGKIECHGFFINSFSVGVWTFYNEQGFIKEKYFFSFEEPNKIIEEKEYKRQLAKIRLGVWKVPALDLKICYYER